MRRATDQLNIENHDSALNASGVEAPDFKLILKNPVDAAKPLSLLGLPPDVIQRLDAQGKHKIGDLEGCFLTDLFRDIDAVVVDVPVNKFLLEIPEDLSRKIMVPVEYADLPVNSLDMPNWLKTRLKSMCISTVSGLGSLSLGDILDGKAMGRVKKSEFLHFVEQLETGKCEVDSSCSPVSGKVKNPSLSGDSMLQLNDDHAIQVPVQLVGRNIRVLPAPEILHPRFDAIGIQKVGDLANRRIGEVVGVKGFGAAKKEMFKRFIEALESGCWVPKSMTYDETLADLVKRLDDFILELAEDEREVLLRRFGGRGGPATLEEIATAMSITRQRIDQLITKTVERKLRGYGCPQMEDNLKVLADQYTGRILPLQPGDIPPFACHSPSLYLCVWAALEPTLPIWTESPGGHGQGPAGGKLEIRSALIVALDALGRNAKTDELYYSMSGDSQGLTVAQFYEALYSVTGKFDVNLEKKTIVSRTLRLPEAVRAVLAKAEAPLSVAEIIERGRSEFGDRWPDREERSIEMMLQQKGPEHKLYHLDAKCYGLKKHFKLAPPRWVVLCGRYVAFLSERGTSASPIEFLRSPEGHEFGIPPHEAARILELDGRFVPVGKKFHFDLKSRAGETYVAPEIRKAVIEVLRKAGNALTAKEVYDGVRRIRGCAFSSVTGVLGKDARIEKVPGRRWKLR
jgi:hypothetical protein